MKKMLFLLICLFASAITLNADQSDTSTPQNMPSGGSMQCYKVKITFDVIQEVRTSRYSGTVISSKTLKSGATHTSRQCASDENTAIDLAKEECHKICSQDGKYIEHTTAGFVFEVRHITSAEVIGSCGDCSY